MWSYSLGYTLYHNNLLGLFDFAGYTQADIKIYGKHRIYLGGEYMAYFGKKSKIRYAIRENLDYLDAVRTDGLEKDQFRLAFGPLKD